MDGGGGWYDSTGEYAGVMPPPPPPLPRGASSVLRKGLSVGASGIMPASGLCGVGLSADADWSGVDEGYDEAGWPPMS